MNKEEFLKKLERRLKFLTDEAKKEELKKYENLNNYDLEISNEVNKIYEARGLNIKINKDLSLIEAIGIIIDKLKIRDKKILGDIILFFVYLLLFIILIKIPFIFVRDMISSIFNVLVTNETLYTIWNLAFELLYAIAAILISIKFIKTKAIDYEKSN